MTVQMTATEVKAKILSLLDAVVDGEEIEITRHGRTIAKLVPASGPAALRGSLIRVAATAGPDEDLFTTDVPWDVT